MIKHCRDAIIFKDSMHEQWHFTLHHRGPFYLSHISGMYMQKYNSSQHFVLEIRCSEWWVCLRLTIGEPQKTTPCGPTMGFFPTVIKSSHSQNCRLFSEIHRMRIGLSLPACVAAYHAHDHSCGWTNKQAAASLSPEHGCRSQSSHVYLTCLQSRFHFVQKCNVNMICNRCFIGNGF